MIFTAIVVAYAFRLTDHMPDLIQGIGNFDGYYAYASKSAVVRQIPLAVLEEIGSLLCN
jgi:hypothetical protein